MKISRKLSNRKVMTLCMHCKRVSHTYMGKCTCCGEYKDYHSLFSAPKSDRAWLWKVMIEYDEQN